jgi:hypothetical protein
VDAVGHRHRAADEVLAALDGVVVEAGHAVPLGDRGPGVVHHVHLAVDEPDARVGVEHPHGALQQVRRHPIVVRQDEGVLASRALEAEVEV